MRYETGDALPAEWSEPLDSPKPQGVTMSQEAYAGALLRAYSGGYDAARAAFAGDQVWGDVRHHRERIEQLKEWVADWKASSLKFQNENRVLRNRIRELESIIERAFQVLRGYPDGG